MSLLSVMVIYSDCIIEYERKNQKLYKILNAVHFIAPTQKLNEKKFRVHTVPLRFQQPRCIFTYVCAFASGIFSEVVTTLSLYFWLYCSFKHKKTKKQTNFHIRSICVCIYVCVFAWNCVVILNAIFGFCWPNFLQVWKSK